MFKQYKGVFEVFKGYWSAYGGLGTLLGSPYLHFAALLLMTTAQFWLAPRCDASGQCAAWWDQSISVLPNLLGFTLGGFAIFIGFGDEKFRSLLAEPDPDGEPNAYIGLCATFVHFILVQALALLAAIVAKGLWFYAPWADPIRGALPWMNFVGGMLGYGLFLYALTSVLAATMHVFRIARLYAFFQSASDQTHESCCRKRDSCCEKNAQQDRSINPDTKH